METIIALLSILLIVFVIVIINLNITKNTLLEEKRKLGMQLYEILDITKNLSTSSSEWEKNDALKKYKNAVYSKDTTSSYIQVFKYFNAFLKEQIESNVAPLKNEIAQQEKYLKEQIESNVASLKNEIAQQEKYIDESHQRLAAAVAPLKNKIAQQEKYIDESHQRLAAVLDDHLSSFPYLAGMVADFLMIDEFYWNNYRGKSARLQERKLRIDTLLREKKELIARSKEIQYQLDFLLTAFPSLADFLDTDYREIPMTFDYTSASHDPTRDYLSAEEYKNLSETEKNQLALDRYIESHHKSKWQIGRDYELSVGYQYEKKGYKVQYTGSRDGVADLGRDLIATKGNQVLIIQCKYWSAEKIIREKHIAQLFGTALCYQTDFPNLQVIPLFVTSTVLSDEARSFAEKLHVTVVEHFAFKEFPRIKCNIGMYEDGERSFIYHLPMDQQYDSVIIDKPGEFLAFTVEEAENRGFRRAFKWHNQ